MRPTLTLALAFSATLLTACSGTDSPSDAAPSETVDQSAALEQRAVAYSDAFLTGDGAAVYDVLSQRCRERITRASFVGMVDQAAAQYGEALPFVSFDADVNGEQARVSYSYEGKPELDQRQEPWVLESGEWMQDDC